MALPSPSKNSCSVAQVVRAFEGKSQDSQMVSPSWLDWVKRELRLGCEESWLTFKGLIRRRNWRVEMAPVEKSWDDSSVQHAGTEGCAQDGIEGYAWDEFLCAISVHRSQRFSIHLIFSLLSITFFSKFISEVVLIITLAKTNQWRSIYSGGQSAQAQGIGQRWCLHLGGRWLISLDEVPIRTVLQPHCCLPGALLLRQF